MTGLHSAARNRWVLPWLFPARLWTHKSTSADFWLFVMGRLLSFAGLFSRFGLAPLVSVWFAGLISSVTGTDAGFAPRLGPMSLALLLWVVVGFAAYWSHRLLHTTYVIWPLHAVHHSAEVLPPLTADRQHPMALIVGTSISTCIVGLTLGVIVGVISPDTPIADVVGVNAFVVVANLTVANFHHAHIWISFGPVLERLFISPAQHHIHHSTKPEHFNRNYGHILAIRDWIFGTLYITRDREDLTFGLDGPTDAPLMSHRLGPILVDPLRRMFFPAH
jgi:sterol desaturase/sphingolipid hydroxylase (fatty acid hydroxylase superfamily)